MGINRKASHIAEGKMNMSRGFGMVKGVAKGLFMWES